MDDDTLELLANCSKKKSNIVKETNTNVIKKPEDFDDNSEILELLKERMQMGIKKYGHGVRVEQNTQDFGTSEDDWELMALEEMLDGLIYTTASIIRYRRKKNIQNDEFIDSNV
tara:strand:+ start:259 stop:600 length:342 start_codon:yes stop_codon:yes gene_type:complete